MFGKKIVATVTAVAIVLVSVMVGSVIANASPYDSAVDMGYKGTEMQMLASLAAETGEVTGVGEIGNSSYVEACENGFSGTEEQWVNLFVDNSNGDTNIPVFEIAQREGFNGSLSEWLTEQSSKNLKKTAKSVDKSGEKSLYTLACEYGFNGSPEEWIASLIGRNESEDTITASETNYAAAPKAAKTTVASAYSSYMSNGGTTPIQRWLQNLFGVKSGESAYEIAVNNGYQGTEVEWLRSLAGKDGKSAYEIARDNGYGGTELEWLASLVGENGSDGESAYKLAQKNGFNGTEKEWLATLIGPSGVQGIKGDKGDKGDIGVTGAQGVKGDKGDTGATGATGAQGKSAYELAQDLGFEGTLSEWLDSLLLGPAGADGKDGVDGKSAYEIACENGFEGSVTQWLASLVGAQGIPGVGGENGKSAYEIACEYGYSGSAQEWLLTLVGNDGESAYEIACRNGYEGTEAQWLASLAGRTGKSAYELAVENGYTGSMTQWLASLVGENGADGKSAYELAKENGYTGTEQQWLLSLVGAQGATGMSGANGKSAYEFAVENGYEGTLAQWLTSLVGPQGVKGDKGDTGAQGVAGPMGMVGAAGMTGKSSYELACENGYQGTIQEWLVSLAGADGQNGVNGLSAYELAKQGGFNGTLQEWLESLVGAQGAKGDKGDKGDTGTSITNTYINSETHLIVVLSDGTEIDAGYIGGGTPQVTTYTVTFVDYNGNELKNQTVNSGESATPPANPSRTGYTFAGWSGSYTNVTANVTITATYIENSSTTYTVTFYDHDGTTILKTQPNVIAGGYATPPTEPTKTGATFLGWSGNYTNVNKNESVRAVYSDQKNVFLISDASGSTNDTVTVLVSIDGSVKTCGFDMTLYYDSNLELVSADSDLDLDVVANTSGVENGIILNFSSATDKTKQRDIIELTFRIKDTSKAALPITATINSVKEVSGSSIVNTDYVVVNGVVYKV